MVSSPAKDDVLLSHSGAEIMPIPLVHIQLKTLARWANRQSLTILYQDREALLDQKGSVKDDQSKAQRQHIVTRPHSQKVSNTLLPRAKSAYARYPPIGQVEGIKTKWGHECWNEDTYQPDSLISINCALLLSMRHWL